jgi:16S rRNA (guanine527-N7)-methyltransferase
MALQALGTGWLPLLRAVEERLGSAGVRVTDEERDRIAVYLDELVTWNRRTDLTAARSAEELVDLTLPDAAVIVEGTRELEADVRSFVDVGAGAGAPGLVVSVLRPEWRGVLVEPRGRRVAFLRTVIGRLGLPVRVERGRSEDLTQAAWDVGMSRATLPPPRWLAEGTRLARRCVWVLLARDEPPDHTGWRIAVDRAYRWPLTGVDRRAACYVPELGEYAVKACAGDVP